MRSDVIHLAGGNTFYFLNNLRKAKLLSELRKYAEKGGILTGLSAGAILMTENIDMAAYPEFDRDENVVNLKNLSALHLLNFAFFPHFKNSARYDAVFRRYSRVKKKVIYACPDGAGIVVNDDKISFVGPCYGFAGGQKFSVN